MAARVFVSFDYDNDKNMKNVFTAQAKNDKIAFDFADFSCKETLPQSKWEEMIKNKINTCNVLLVLVSTHSVQATGVKKEIKMAVDQNVPVIGIYLPDSNGNYWSSKNATLPEGLYSSNCETWTAENVQSLIDNAMNKGKNRQ
ncbi:MAG TPA: TIR domain-containing protein [Alphaproteobacteria bacterium]|nr:TIR domain-containing protein [Alphaproteobacteria bacterium]